MRVGNCVPMWSIRQEGEMNDTAYQYVKDELAKKSMQWHKLQQGLLLERNKDSKERLLLECRQLENHVQHLIEVYNRYIDTKNKKGIAGEKINP